MTRSLGCIVFLILLSVCVRAQSDPTSLIHFGDVIEVDFIGSADNDWRGGIAVDGTLDTFVTYGEPIRAACRSSAEVAADIADAYSKLLREPKVVVTIVDRSKRQPITVRGAVRTPTRFQVLRVVRLREILVRSGGITDNSSGEISILRPPGAGCQTDPAGSGDNALRSSRIKISDLLEGKPEADVPLLSGDTVEVEQAAPVYVIGAVNNPRPVYSKGDLTVSRAIASAGGLSKDAKSGKAVIFRREGVDTTIIDVDLAKIRADISVDVSLKPFDILDVTGKAGGKRSFPPIAGSSDNSSVRRELPIRLIDR